MGRCVIVMTVTWTIRHWGRGKMIDMREPTFLTGFFSMETWLFLEKIAQAGYWNRNHLRSTLLALCEENPSGFLSQWASNSGASGVSHIYIYIYIYTCLLLLIPILWHRQTIFESKGDKLSSDAECRIRTQGLKHLFTSRLNAWPTELSRIKLINLNSTARTYDQQAFSPLDLTASWLCVCVCV